MADSYMSELAAATGLPVCPHQGPFGQKEGAVIGARDGYLLAIGPGHHANSDQVKAVNIMLRFGAVENIEQISSALKTSQALDAAEPQSDMDAKKTEKNTKAGQDFLITSMSYTFKKPKPPAVAALATALLDTIKNVAPPLGNKCELCKSNTVSDIMLWNTIPGNYCPACQESERVNAEQAGRAYEAQEANYINGLALGLLAALAGSLAWGFITYWTERIFVWGAIGIGLLIGFAFFKGVGKIENLGRIIVAVLTVLSVLFGDAIFFTLVLMKELNLPFSMELLQLVITKFTELESESTGYATYLFALAGALIALYSMRKPAFHALFEPLRPQGA
jgi:hypothetical protein